MLKFDEESTALFETAYQGADITRRRQASFDMLRPAPGEVILDIGCGNGLLTAELARAVGAQGRVIGIDLSADMLEAARARCREFDQVELIEAAAGELPLADGMADKAVSIQVFEYIPDVRRAVLDTLRCLRPGGRIVISDVHSASLIWFSDDPDRMARMKASWEAHFVTGDLPEWLPAHFKSLGHEVEQIGTYTVTDHELRPDGLAVMLMHLMRQHAVEKAHMSPQEAEAWFDEQYALAREGRFFFSYTQFVMVLRKAG